ncbi:MAG: DUF839 domain-containing protein [Gammaproteobacteria bacterium]|nr:DUF839 domain-containing protein [Gammaproteobacteria bacterium]
MKKALLATLVAAACTNVHAGTDIYFNPLTQSTAVAQVPNHVNEINNPWQVPAGVSQQNLTSLKEVEADITQSIIRVPGLGTNASMFDMSAFDPTGRYVFIPHETQFGAGVTRYDTKTDRAVNIVAGDGTGLWSSDYGAFDPATWTPVNTLLVGEEWSGQGRLFEIVNPMADVENGETVEINELNSVPNVSHEGLRFNADGSALYFVDEDRSGSVYKFVPSVAGDYSKGQSFVLSVDGFAGDTSANAPKYGETDYTYADRTGPATWVALTDADGNALTEADPFDNVTRGGRAAADEQGGTPYRRPEDVEVGKLANGNEVLYFNATEEQGAFSVEELGNGKAMVRLMANEDTVKNLGYPATSGHITSPDNLAQDAFGNIYMVEDWPNGSDKGGDIWFLRDTNGDGVAESVDHFMSLQVKGAENTGMIFRPNHPTQFIVSVQHPESTDVADGQGDALWLIDVKDVVAPPCVKGDDEHHDRRERRGVKTCSKSNDTNFIKKMSKTRK